MKDVQKPDHVSLNGLISRLKEGRFVIPDFQRDFEWKPWDIKDLIRSIFLDYYIGSLLLWKGTNDNFDALSCEVIYGFDDTAGDGSYSITLVVPDFQPRGTYNISVHVVSSDHEFRFGPLEWFIDVYIGSDVFLQS